VKTKKVIELLQKADPSGENEVCVDNMDIYSIHSEPAYWNGTQQVLERNESDPGYNVVSAKYKTSGTKIVIQPLSILDAICNEPYLQIDYSELSDSNRDATIKHNQEHAEWIKNLENRLLKLSFIEWAKEKISKITANEVEMKSEAETFFEDRLLHESKIPQILKHSQHESAKIYWESKFEISIENGFLEIKDKQ